MRCNQLQPPENAEEEERQLQAALAASRESTSVHEDQTSGSGAAAAPDDLVEAVAPIVRRGQTSASGAAVAPDEASEPEPEADLVAASCAPAARGRGRRAKAAARTQESEESMLPKMLQRAYTAGQSALPKLAGLARKVERTPRPPAAYEKRHFYVLLRGVDGVDGKTGIFQGKYEAFQGYVKEGNAFIWHGAVFHGFHTEAEAREYWRGAKQEQPWNSLEPRLFIECSGP